MWWHEQTWLKLQAMDKSIPVLVPLGSVEQHGHHLPLCVDTTQVSEVAVRANNQLQKQILVLPTLWLGCSEHHRDFPGTVSVRPSVYAETIKGIARSVL